MTQITMYSGFNNSPKTKLTADITFSDTVIPVESVSVFPEGPNLATIGAGNDAELIRYASISGNNLIGCERGFYGTTASAWYSETKIARYFSRYDADAMKNNIEDLVSDKVSDADLGDLALLDTVGNTQIDAMPANTIKGNNLSTSSSPDDLTVDETVEMIFGGLSTETTPAPIDTDKFISEITRSSTVSRVLVTFATIKNYILGALFSTSTGHSHNGSDSKKISGSDLNSVVPVTLGGTNANSASNARSNLSVAPNDAEYIVAATDSELSNGLVLTAGTGVSLAQDNAAHTLEVSVDDTITTNKYYIDQSGGTSDSYGVLSGSVNGSNYTFTVSQGKYISGSLEVYLNGQLQTQGSSEDWVEANPLNGSFSFNTAPISGDLITAKYLITSIVTVGEGSDIDVAFSEASSISNINTGETLSTIFGKIKKFFNNLTGHDHDGTDSKKVAYSDLTGLPTLTPAGIGALPSNPIGIELFPASSTANNGGYIDFHYNRSTDDYTSRLTESVSGTITLTGNLAVTGKISCNDSDWKTIWTGNAGSGTALAVTENFMMTLSARYELWATFGAGVDFYGAHMFVNAGGSNPVAYGVLNTPSGTITGVKIVLGWTGNYISTITPTFSVSINIRSVFIKRMAIY